MSGHRGPDLPAGYRAVALRRWRRSPALHALPPPRLRFDRVAQRVIDGLRAAARDVVPEGMLVLVTLVAPIRVASKTQASIEGRVRALAARRPSGRPRHLDLHGNRLCLAALPAPARASARLLCLVHTHPQDTPRLLRMTRDLLDLGTESPPAAAGAAILVQTPERRALLPCYQHLYAQLGFAGPRAPVFIAFGDVAPALLTG